MARQRMRGPSLRSMNRRSMDSTFGPLDPGERLPRELLDERPSPRGMSFLARRNYWPGRKELAAAAWLPASILLMMAASLGWLHPLLALGAAGLVAIGLIGFGLSGATARS